MTLDQLIHSEVYRQRHVLERLRVDREDLAQDVHVSLLRRPLTTPPGTALRRIEIRRRVGGCLRDHGAVLRGGRYLGPKGAFRTDRPSISGWSEAQEPGAESVFGDPWVARCVDALPTAERQVIRAYFWEQATGPEIGARLGRTKQWVSWIKARALTTLRAQLEAR
jgi:DNA-directed RNA polymerase specialized sigma24 family protein